MWASAVLLHQEVKRLPWAERVKGKDLRLTPTSMDGRKKESRGKREGRERGEVEEEERR